MTAKEAFEQLGFIQKIYENKERPQFSGIQYIKKEGVGWVSTKYIEFYPSSKEVMISDVYEHRDGSTSKGTSGVLSAEEFKAIQKQIEELNW